MAFEERKGFQDAVRELGEHIGWSRVKKTVKELVDLCSLNHQRQLEGLPEFPVLLNRMFLGNPGTGKTTCAFIYARLLAEMGLVSKGEVLVKSASDFIGDHVGQSQTNTKAILEEACGNVLIIDEAYAFDNQLYGKNVLDTIVEIVQDNDSTGSDMAVLLVGYENPMLKMIQENNPGLLRRFPPEHCPGSRCTTGSRRCPSPNCRGHTPSRCSTGSGRGRS